MRYLIIGVIQLYRIIIPPQRRSVCLFRESCSVYVERMAREFGSTTALWAFYKRFRCCRPGYTFEFSVTTDMWQLVCADGSRFSMSEVAPHITTEFQNIIIQVRR